MRTPIGLPCRLLLYGAYNGNKRRNHSLCSPHKKRSLTKKKSYFLCAVTTWGILCSCTLKTISDLSRPNCRKKLFEMTLSFILSHFKMIWHHDALPHVATCATHLLPPGGLRTRKPYWLSSHMTGRLPKLQHPFFILAFGYSGHPKGVQIIMTSSHSHYPHLIMTFQHSLLTQFHHAAQKFQNPPHIIIFKINPTSHLHLAN